MAIVIGPNATLVVANELWCGLYAGTDQAPLAPSILQGVLSVGAGNVHFGWNGASGQFLQSGYSMFNYTSGAYIYLMCRPREPRALEYGRLFPSKYQC